MEWDKYFLEMAEVVSKRSPDPNTKHGCVLVDANHRVLSTGYNGPVQDIPHSVINWERPHKYLWIIHAEDNAVTFSKCDLSGATAYITGRPCVPCLRRLVQAGISKIVCGPRESKCISEEEIEVSEVILREKNVSFITNG